MYISVCRHHSPMCLWIVFVDWVFWIVFVDCVCGLRLWIVVVDCVCGLCLWIVFVDWIYGYEVRVICGSGKMRADLDSSTKKLPGCGLSVLCLLEITQPLLVGQRMKPG